MNKKVCVMFVLALISLTLISNFVSAQYDVSNIFGVSAEGVNITADWKTWGADVKNNLLANPIIQGIDSFFQQITGVFSVLFGMPYSLSLALLLIIALWIYFLLIINNALQMSLFSKWVSLLISFGVVIIMAQVKIFETIVNLVIQLFFGENEWYVKVILGLIIVVALVFIFMLLKQFAKQRAENRKKKKDEENRLKLETGAKVGEELSKAVTKNE
jgi:hypothetical protein